MDTGGQVQSVKVERPLYDQEDLNKAVNYEAPKKNLTRQLANVFNCKPVQCVLNSLPILKWLPAYNWRTHLTGDLVAGFTVAVMHIPQGMAYALLANVPPIVGIYMAFFPVLAYIFLGTSRHNSMGTFAVICLMTGKTVLEFSNLHPNVPPIPNLNGTDAESVQALSLTSYSPVEVAAALCLLVGIIQIIMWMCRLGIVSTLLSDTLVNGFTTGAAIHVLTSQIPDLFGIKIPKFKGNFQIIEMYISIFQQLHTINWAAAVAAVTTMCVITLNNELLKPWISKKCPLPVPIELIVVVTGTLLSKYFNFHTEYSMSVIGFIPSGLPTPSVPPLGLMKHIMVDGLTVSIVSYTVSLSMALIFAQKLGYEIDANQELLAQGVSNTFGSFFSCMPFTASLSRSLIQQTSGGNSQLTSLFSCGIILFILLWIGPFFEPLPKCFLAAVIVVALKGMLMQAKSLAKFWRLSKLDAFVWIVTFLTVVLVNIDVGLLIGVLASLGTIVFRGMRPYTCILGIVEGTDIYLDTTRYRKAVEIPDMKIYHFSGSLNFASRDFFKSDLYKKINVNPKNEITKQKKFMKLKNMKGITNEAFATDSKIIEEQFLHDMGSNAPTSLKNIILDFSALGDIDPSGASTLKIIVDDFIRINVRVYVTGCSAPVYEMLKKVDLINDDDGLRAYPTIHDAVQSTVKPLVISSIRL